MKNLMLILQKQLENLATLTDVTDAEQLLLCAGSIESPQLRAVTEKKSALLAELASMDQQRCDREAALALRAPYSNVPLLNAQWQKIQQRITSLHAVNMQNGSLLSHHIAHNTKALAILNAHRQVSLYGPDGRISRISKISQASA